MTERIEAALELLSAKETKKRLEGSTQLEELLSGPQRDGLRSISAGQIVDVLSAAIKDNNFRVSQTSLIALLKVIEFYGSDIRPYCRHIANETIERFSDAKAPVRNAATAVILGLMTHVGVKDVFEYLKPFIQHKNGTLRGQLAHTVKQAVTKFGVPPVSGKEAFQYALKLLNDSNELVRENCIDLLVDLYAIIGDRIKDDLYKNDVRPAQLAIILERFDGTSPAPQKQPDSPISNLASSGLQKPNGPKPVKTAKRGKGSISSTANGSPSSRLKAAASVSELSVEPVRLYSENELTSEMETLAALINGYENPWDDRMKGLKRLQGIITGGAPELPNFAQAFVTIINPLCTQCCDLRSTLNKEACETVTVIANYLGDGFDQWAEPFINTLLTQIFVTVKVIAESASACLNSVVQKVKLTKGMVKIVEGTKGKHQMQRQRCLEAMMEAMQAHDTAYIHKFEEIFAKAIVERIMNESAPNGRKVARQCYWEFRKHCRSRAEALFNKLDATNQKRVLAEESSSSSPSTAKRLTRTQTAATRRFQRPATSAAAMRRSNTTNTVLSSSQGPPVEVFAAPKPSNADFEPKVRRSASVSEFDDVDAVTAKLAAQRLQGGSSNSAGGMNSTWPAKKPLDEDVVVAAKPAPKRVAAAPTASANTGASSNANSGLSMPMRVLRPASTAAKPGSKASGGLMAGASRVKPEAPAAAPAAAVATATSTTTGENSSATSTSAGSGSANSSPRHEAPRVAPKEAKPLKRQPTASSDTRTKTSRRPSTTTAEPPAADEQQDVGVVLETAKSRDWTVRVDCFKKLSAIIKDQATNALSSSRGPGSAYGMREKIVYIIAEHVNDAHFKVSVAALNTLTTLLKFHGKHLEQYMDKVLPTVFLKLSDNREAVRSAANGVLRTVTESISGMAIIPLLIKIFDSSSGNAKVRLGSLELLLHLIPANAGTYFGSESHVRSCFAKAYKCIHESNTDLRKSAVAVLAALFQVNLAAWTARYSILASADQTYLRKLLAVHILDIDTQLGISAEPAAPSPEKEEPVPQSALARIKSQRSAATHHHQQAQHHAPAATTAAAVPEKRRELERTASAPVSDIPSARSGGAYSKPRDLEKENHNPRPYSTAANAGDLKSRLPSAFQAKQTSMSATEWSREIPSLMNMLADPATCKEAAGRIAQMSSDNQSPVWSQYFGQVLLVVLDVMKNPSVDSRELSIHLLREMLKNQSRYFQDFIEIVLARLLECYKDTMREICQAAEDALTQFVAAIPPLRTLEVLTPIIMTEDGPPLQGAVRLLSKLVGRIAPDVLMKHIPGVLPGLFEAFKNPMADIRKAVVFALVDIYMVLGDDFTPYLSELNTSQLKLVTIYINRMTKRSAGGVEGAASVSSSAM